MAEKSKIAATLTPEERKKLEAKLKSKAAMMNASPMSYSQQRLWVLYQLDPASAAYNIPGTMRLKGNVDIEAFEQSLQDITDRHETLRTRFASLRGKPVQLVSAKAVIDFEYIDLCAVDVSDSEARAIEMMKQDAARPFDLARLPLFRTRLYRVADKDFFLLINIHHIISDGWSIQIFIRELAQIYKSLHLGEEPNLPPLPIQFADFAKWQRKWLQGDVLQKQLEYWKKKLNHLTPVLDVPTDFQRPAVKGARGGSCFKTLPQSVADGLKHLAEKEGVTPFILYLAAFQVYLNFISRQDDIAVGSAIANRHRKEVEPLIGFFVNTLVFRALIDRRRSFVEFLQDIKNTAFEAYAHQDLPFEMLVEALNPQRDMSRTPLFQASFAYSEETEQQQHSDEFSIEPFELGAQMAKFDLAAIVLARKNDLALSIVFDADLFEMTTIERMLSQFAVLLTDILKNPTAPLFQLSILPPEDVNKMTVEWPSPAEDVSPPLLFHQGVERTAEKYPDAVAVYCDDQILSFDALNRRANRVARFLRKKGVGVEQFVGLVLNRSVDLIVALLAIHKAGGAYVPADPNYPKERLAQIFGQGHVSAILTSEELRDDLAGIEDIEIYALDSDKGLWQDESDENLSTVAQPKNAAYAIYTSGSTGQPKGVVIQHDSLLNLAGNLKTTVYDSLPVERARISLNAPLAFDASVQQVVMMMFGHALYIIPQEMRADAAALRNFIAEKELHVVDCVPSQLKLMIQEGLLDDQQWRPLAMLPGGEAIDPDTWQRIARCGDIRFYNMYGPTECTVDSTIHSVSSGDLRPVIGKPVKNARFYILDAHLSRMPIGVPGELFIAGAGLARGYFSRPDLTAERFLPDPFSARAGERMYKTGDLARFLSNGHVEFLGRTDFQVKIRGFRIELEEIEQALQRHPAVNDVLVSVKESGPENKHIVAYFLSNGMENSSVRLYDFLAEKLPSYMIPAAFVPLEAFPLLPNGKIDRRSLPDPDFSLLGGGSEFAAPQTPTEELLADVFCNVLNLDKISVTANFFELGGHSLLATQVISRIRDVFHVDLPLRVLFEYGDVRRLAQSIDKTRLSEDGNGVPPIGRVADGAAPPLSFAQQRMWFLDQLEPGSPQYHIPSAVRIRGELNIDALQKCLQEIARRHQVLRTAFVTVDGKPKIDVVDDVDVSIPMEDISSLDAAAQDARVKELIVQVAKTPFHLAQAPLFRVNLVKLAENGYVFELVMHHIISDGWSSGVMIREIGALYEAMLRDEPSPLPELEIQYSDFAAWQRNWLQGEVLEKQLDYWKKQLAAGSDELALPTDRPRPAFQTLNGDHLTFQLPAELSADVTAFSRRENSTPFMTLLAAFKTLLARYANQRDISVGTPIANRNRVETENLIGFFINTLVVRSDLSDNPSFRVFLQRIKQTTLDAYAHQDVPFEKVVDAVQPQRNTSGSPLFQVMFMMQNLPAGSLDLHNITLEQLEIETNISNFDITMSMEEHDGILFGSVEYNTDLFNRSTIERMVLHYQNVLRSLLSEPERKILDVEMASAKEQHLLLQEWNRTERDFATARVIHSVVEKQADATPDAVAVRFGDKELTYTELNARANKVAHYLIQKGARPDALVGLCMERSLDMIVSLLGVLKSGAGYLPVDPNYPRERIEFMLQDTGAKILLTQQRLADVLPENGTEIIEIDSQWGDIAGQSTRNPGVKVAPQNLAYVIYTSGSTGTPKGVLVTHEGVVNHNNVIRKNFHYTPADRVLQFFSLNFDGAVEEIFPTLMSGATLVLRPNDVVMSVDELLDLAAKERLTVLDVPTAYWHELAFELDHYKKILPESVRLVITGGEAASPERYATWKKNVGDRVQWLNTYGPTEGTVIATIYDPAANPDHDMLTMPIGAPLANDKIYIVDQNLNLTPIGVPGELCIGGLGVARGYLNRPDLTAEKFIPDPFSGVDGARLYRTGDLARWREDGNVDFIGRVDDQVKIRGFRVELGEIESALRAHADIREAAVVARRDGGQDKKLAAYYVTENNKELDVNALRAFLKENVPDYMIPHAFVRLEALPKMISGKVDRKALPKPEFEEAEMTGSDEPENETEEKLVEIVADILGRQNVGANDNFFELGGDSIMSIQVIAKANQAGVKLTPRQLFENPTIRGLAAVAGAGAAVVAEQGKVSGPLPLTPIMHWFFEQNFVEAHHWNQSLLFQVDQALDGEALRRAFAGIVEHHDALRLHFTQQNDVWSAVHSAVDGAALVQEFDFSNNDAAEYRKQIEEQCAALQQQLDPESGKVMVVAYFNLGETSRLFIAVHHLAVDGVSWRILLQDIQTAYEQAAAGQEIKLPPKTTSFKYWAERLADYATSATAAEEAPYWTHYERQLVAPLPVDFAENPAMNDEQSAQNVAASLTKEETTKLLQELPAALDARINDILLAALVQAFNKWTGKPSLLIDMEGHGRENLFDDVDISRTVGWFTSLYPLFLKLDRNVSGKEAVLAIKNQLRTLPKNGIGYGLLRYLSNDDDMRRKLARLPAPQVSFNYLGQFDRMVDGASVFKAAGEAKGEERSPRAQRSNLIDVTAIVNGGQMHISFSYSRNIYKKATIQAVLHAFVDVLKKMTTGEVVKEQPLQMEKSAPNLNKRQMNKVLAQLNKKGKRF